MVLVLDSHGEATELSVRPWRRYNKWCSWDPSVLVLPSCRATPNDPIRRRPRQPVQVEISHTSAFPSYVAAALRVRY